MQRYVWFHNLRTFFNTIIPVRFIYICIFIRGEKKRILFKSPFTNEKLKKKTGAPEGTDRSLEYNEHIRYKLDSKVKI